MFIKDANFIDETKFPVKHGFYTRKGGVSEGLYNALNCSFSSQDNQADIRENRAHITATLDLDPDKLVTLDQVHSKECLIVKEPWSDTIMNKADAMATDCPDLALGILTADCAPVLFYGEKETNNAPVIAAAHAGWGGAFNGVLEETVSSMVRLGASLETLRACIGPCIGPESYEVSKDFQAPFLEQDDGNEHFFKESSKAGYLLFDLPGYVIRRLALAGLTHISSVGHDTYAEESLFFSYRRSTLAGEKDYGRQISVISIQS